MKKKISIIGCGWLGKVLARALLNEGFIVHGSTTQKNNLVELKALGVVPHLIKLNNDGVFGELPPLLEDMDVLILAFPPGMRRDLNADYAARVSHVLSAIPKNFNGKIIHLSSIGVFGLTQGIVTEDSIPKPESFVGNALLQAETYIKNFSALATVVRLGGLVGDGRHPARQLAGKTTISAPKAPINLVHQKDVVSFLVKLIQGNHWGDTLHCVSPIDTERAPYYTRECLENNLAKPGFSQEESTRTKKVLDTKSEGLLGHHYQLPNCRIQDG